MKKNQSIGCTRLVLPTVSRGAGRSLAHVAVPIGLSPSSVA